jgi:2,3-bisphosphoglycerate-dependent phosphoglycerate mutase
MFVHIHFSTSTSPDEVVLMRHGESLWNRERRFISWVDSPLTDRGVEEARAAGLAIADDGIKFDIVYTSMLKRAIKTAWTVLEASDQCPVPVSPDWRLNERFVGCLIGHTMESATELYGQDRMKDWRSTADIPPAPLDPSSPYNPALDPKYDFLDRNLLPSSECLLDVRA